MIERTVEPTTWLTVTGWDATVAERKILETRMSTDPWTDPDPRPGDFDEELAKLDPRFVERHEGGPEAKLIVLVAV